MNKYLFLVLSLCAGIANSVALVTASDIPPYVTVSCIHPRTRDECCGCFSFTRSVSVRNLRNVPKTTVLGDIIAQSGLSAETKVFSDYKGKKVEAPLGWTIEQCMSQFGQTGEVLILTLR